MKVAVIQMTSVLDFQKNLDFIDKTILEIKKESEGRDVQAIFLPEVFYSMSDGVKASPYLVEEGNEHFENIRNIAKKHEVYLLGGSAATIGVTEDSVVNRCYNFSPQGELLGSYDKIHLFDVTVSKVETWKESNVYDRGDKAVMAEIDGAKLGLSICYDLRFPSLYRHYGQAGADIIAVPAAFTRPTGEAHWESLLRARAIETGSFVIAPAQGGPHEDGRTTYGHSLIIGPWGDILAHLDSDEPGYICADIDITDVAEARRRIPAWNHDPD